MSTDGSARTDDYLRELRALVDRAAALLMEDDPAALPASAYELLDGLTDLAARYQAYLEAARTQDHLVFETSLEAWSATAPSEDADWPSLVTLWWMYASRFARSLAAVPAAERRRPHARHNLHETLWRPVPADAPATLDDLGRDFDGHLRHVLGRLGVPTDVPSRRTR